MSKVKKVLLLAFTVIITIVFSNKTYASHAVGADINYECLGNNQYKITLNFYRDCAGIAAPANATITIKSATCGINQLLSLALERGTEVSGICPAQANNSTCNGGTLPGLQQYVYSNTVTLPAECTDWNFSYTHCCRNSAITNLNTPSARNLYVQATLNNTNGLCNNSPVFTTLPVPYICTNQLTSYNHGATDSDGDSLHYTSIVPMHNATNQIPYIAGYSSTYPLSLTGSFGFSNSTGQMTITPNAVQNAVITVLVNEYRNGVLIGSTMRDMQFVVINCNNNVPVATGINGTNDFSINFCRNQSNCFEIFTSDTDANQTLTLSWNNAIPGATFTTSGSTPKGTFCWTPGPQHSGSYTFLATVKDDACPVNGSNIYAYTINIGDGITTSISNSSTSCAASSGEATVSVTGGSGNYSYLWSTSPAQTTATATGLSAGTYIVTVTDNNPGSCGPKTDTVVILQSPNIVVTSNKTDPTCGGSDGSITISASGGASPYTYSWSNGASGSTITGLASGAYTYTATDANGCSSTSTVTLSEGNAPVIQITKTNASCSGGSDGSATASVTGGTAPYKYDWSNGSDIYNPTNLPAGSYTLTVTDANNCTSTASVNITAPVALTVNVTSVHVTCNGENNGYISLTTSGGITPYQYLWADGGTSNSRTNLSAGTYAVTVTDNNSCSSTLSIDITQPVALTLSETHTDISCSGGGGSITLTASGGTGSISYEWNDGITTKNRNNLSAGTYTVTATDANGCSANLSVIISGAGLTVTETHTNITCNGGNNGSINLTTTGGTAPISFIWSDGGSGSSRTNLSAGTYAVTVTDNNSCSSTLSIDITQPVALTITETHTDISCSGGGGSITLTATGGTGSIGYEWNDGITTKNRINLAAGTYTVTATDANGCSATLSVTISGAGFAVTETHTNITCNGESNGSISLTTSGGTAPISFIWSDGGSGSSRTNLSAGTYAVTITDNNSCSSTLSIDIIQPSALTLSESHTDISCSGGGGSITITDAGGTGSISYVWNDGITTKNRINLAAGAYTVTATDANGCSATLSATISGAGLAVTETHTYITCNGESNGSISLTTSGGTAPISFVWSDGGSGSSRSNLSAGTYAVTVTDVNSCSSMISIDITQPSALIITETHTDISCSGGGGSISINEAGGTGSIGYEWNDGITTKNRINLAAGTYTVTATDANGCSAALSVTISGAGLAVTETHTNITCNGGSNGSINLTTTGGTAPISFIWSDGGSGSSRTSLSAGTYSVTVTDNNSCSSTLSIDITQPSALTITEAHTDISCSGGGGSITLTDSGGTGSIGYVWNDGITTKNRNNLAAGPYTVTATDANGCSATLAITISGAGLAVTETHTNITCNGESNGSINLTTSGGTAPFSFVWSDGGSGSSRTNLSAGTYAVTVTDNNSCSSTLSIDITQPTALTLSETHTDISCFGGNNGSINLTAQGGSTPYLFNWNDGSTNKDRTNLQSGVYSVTVFDNNGCSDSISVTITETGLEVEKTFSNVSCSGGSDGVIEVSVISGASPITYEWNDNFLGKNRKNLSSGYYTLTVTDANSCTATVSVIISEPEELKISTSAKEPTCNGATDGSITSVATGGVMPYAYKWNTLSTAQSIKKLPAGNYSLTVTDKNNCIATKNIALMDPAPMIIDAEVTDPSCATISNGSVELDVTGSTAPYTYLWSDGSTGDMISDLAAGTHSVTVTDLNGCSAEAFFLLSYKYDFTVEASADLTLLQGKSAQLGYSVSGTSGNYSGIWGPATGLDCTDCENPTATPSSSQSYVITILNEDGCEATDTVRINIFDVNTLYIPNAFSPNDDELNDYFQVFGNLENLSNLDVEIYDRWGEKIFESNDPYFTWDGSFLGERLTSDVFVYVIRYQFRSMTKKQMKKGTVTLLR